MKKTQIAIVLTVILMTISAACAQNKQEAGKTLTAASPIPTRSSSCAPLETGTANAPEQKPAFPGQTRACAVKSDAAFDVIVVAKGLDHPWAVEPLPNGDFLITEKAGKFALFWRKAKSGSRSADCCRLDKAACRRPADREVCRRLRRAGKAGCSTLL